MAFSNSLIKRLNDACAVLSCACDKSCDNIGWCEACWITARVDYKKLRKKQG